MIKMGNPKELLRKHKPLTSKQVKEKFRQQREMKKKLTTNATELDQNLKKFNEITDPLIDPESNTVLCWIRRPTTEELEALIPMEILEYRNSDEPIPLKVSKKHEDFQFEMMADLITNPVHDAKWWKKHANLIFQSLFQLHIQGVMSDLGISAENF